MNSRKRCYYLFTVLYWIIITIGLILFGLSFQKVPINSYGLRSNSFSSEIENKNYFAGNYFKQFEYYFITLPSSKVYLTDLKVNVTNNDMQVIGVQYTLVYRLLPQQVYSLYTEFLGQYESRIIAVVNSIISKQFSKLSQQQTRVTIQPSLITAIQTNFGDKLPNLQKCVQIEAMWLNSLDFYARESEYENAYLYASSYSPAYEKMQIQLQKTNLRIETLKNLLTATKEHLNLSLEGKIMESSSNYTKQAQTKAAEKELFLSQSNVSQIFQFYQSPEFVLV